MTTPHNGLPAIHPGEFLRETLDELGLTQAAFASALGISPMRVSYLLKGDRVELLDEADGWLQLRYRNPSRGPVLGWVKLPTNE